MHSEPVQVFSVEIACSYNLPSGIIHILKIATSFHEIVKIGIPDNIFLKPGCFDAAEWQVMKKHSIIGEQIMLATELEGAEQAPIFIRHHHE